MTENGGILMSLSINISHSGYQNGSAGNEAYRVSSSICKRKFFGERKAKLSIYDISESERTFADSVF